MIFVMPFRFIGPALVQGARVDATEAPAGRIEAMRAASTLLEALDVQVREYRWAKQLLAEVPERPAEGARIRDRWDAAAALFVNASASVVALHNAAPGLEMIETWEDGDAWTPAVSVDTGVESQTFGRVTVLYEARTASADEIEAERAVALERLRARFQTSRDAGTTVTLGGEAVPLATTPQAQGEIKSLKEYIAARPNGTTQAIRTRSGRCIDAGLAIAEAMHAAVEAHVSDAWTNDATLGAAIAAAETIAAIRAVDIEAGWPEVAE